MSRSTSVVFFLEADVSSHGERAGENRKWNSICSVKPAQLLLAEISVNQEQGGLTLHACRRASAFKSRFNAWEKEIHFYSLYWESIQRVKATLLDCHGNCWEKWFLSVSMCISHCWRGCIVSLYGCAQVKNLHYNARHAAFFKNRLLGRLTYILHALTLLRSGCKLHPLYPHVHHKLDSVTWFVTTWIRLV